MFSETWLCFAPMGQRNLCLCKYKNVFLSLVVFSAEIKITLNTQQQEKGTAQTERSVLHKAVITATKFTKAHNLSLNIYIISLQLKSRGHGLFMKSIAVVRLWSYLLFEFLYLTGHEAVRLSDERNHINFILQGLHELYINWTKPTAGHRFYLHVTCI